MARPSSYKEEYAEQAEKLCKLGAIDRELADFFGVSEQTVNAWKTSFPKFFESIKKGKTQADAEVASKLFHRAIGYEHADCHVSNYQGEITVTPLIKHYAPDPVAAIFWLKNRRPDQWRDKQEREITIRRSVEDLADDELNRIAAGSSNRATEAQGSAQEPSKLH